MSAAEQRRGVVIIGLGLIGGSLAHDLAAAGDEVTGVDADPAVRDAARAAGVIRRALPPDAPLPRDTGLVVLAAPVPAIPGLLRVLAASGDLASTAPGDGSGPGLVVTDAASTKRSIMAAAAGAGLGDRFVGGHPMAGDHRRGWGAARPGLFRDARVWLCPGAAAPAATTRVEALWRAVGARPEITDAAEHDRLVARVSHLPQAVASALAGALADAAVDPDHLGPGGRDTTRLAAGDPDLWTGILLDNADELSLALRGLGDRLAALTSALEAGDAAGLRRWLAEAADWRPADDQAVRVRRRRSSSGTS